MKALKGLSIKWSYSLNSWLMGRLTPNLGAHHTMRDSCDWWSSPAPTHFYKLAAVYLSFSDPRKRKAFYDWFLSVAWKLLGRVQLCNPMDTIRGILQAWILEWGAFPFSGGSSQPRDWTQVSRIAGGFFTSWATREVSVIYSFIACQNKFKNFCLKMLPGTYYVNVGIL